MATEDYRLSIIREKLVKDNIKLWLPPYTNEDGTAGTYPEELIEKYYKEYGFPKNIIISLIEHLRLHSVENLAARTKYRETGLATIKVKITCGREKKLDLNMSDMVIEVSLLINGQQLKEKISEKIGLTAKHLKLIAAGHVIKEEGMLSEQNIKPFSQVMALLVDDPLEIAARDQQEALLRRTKEDAELLSLVEEVNPEYEHYLQVADQSGRVLKLPPEERKALSIAMTLNEKGRAAMKKKDYADALVFFLEADREFQQSTSDILSSVDNYALLCLDIAWCYLCLNSVSQFPDAVARLKKCETCFHRSYGTNLERLVALKGCTGHEAALFARLHLLQGIVAYHRNEKDLARALFNRTSAELADLKVDDGQLSQVIALGYTPAEARIALRGCKGNVELAVQYIIGKREEKAEIKTKEKEERKKQKRQRALGKTVNGEWINLDNYDYLCSMGYNPKKVKLALQQTNNNPSAAIDVIQEQQEALNFSNSEDNFEEDVVKLVSLGLNVEDARKAMEKSGDVEKAIVNLFDNNTNPGTSKQTNAAEAQAIANRMAAADRLAEDISEYEEDYLDLTLKDEENFLKEYLILIESNPDDC